MPQNRRSATKAPEPSPTAPRGTRPRLGDEDKPISGPELRTLVEHLARLAVREDRRGLRRGPRRRDQLMVELAALTGLRASELARLRVGDVHLADQRSYLRVRGGKARGLVDVDTVPIPWDLVPALEGWIRGRGDGDPVFERARGGELDRHELWRVVKRALRRCGLRSTLNVHSLRHFFISTVAQRPGASTFTVAKLARLRSLRLVETYCHAHLVDRFATVGPLHVPGRRRRKRLPRAALATSAE